MQRVLGKINWALLLVYLLVAGGIVSVTLFLSLDLIPTMLTEIALIFLFTALGAASYVFYVADGGWAWRVLAALWWLGALLTMILYAIFSGMLPPSLAIAVLCFTVAGGVLYLANRRRERRERGQELEWQALGTLPEHADVEQISNLTAAEYETMMARRRRDE